MFNKNIITCLILTGISITTHAADSPYIGDKLINLVTDNSHVSPPPNIVKELFKECKFTTNKDDPIDYYSKKCTIKNAAPDRSKNTDEIALKPLNAGSGLIALQIRQLQYDGDGGLELFNLPDVKKIPISCTNDDDSKFYTITKKGTPKFVISQNTSGGSGGTGTDTIIYFNKTDPDCKYFNRIAKDLDAPKQVIMLPPVGSTKMAAPKSNPKATISQQNRTSSAPAQNTTKSGNYSNLVACIHPHVDNIAFDMVTNLMQVAANSPQAFGNVITNPTYAKYCQIAYGVPGQENIQNGRKVTQVGNAVYWATNRGRAAIGFVEHR